MTTHQNKLQMRGSTHF